MNIKLPFLYFITTIFLLLLNACSPVEKIKPEVIKVIKETKVEPERLVVKEKPELNVAILLSGPAETFKNTSSILVNKLNAKTKKYVLSGDISKDKNLIRAINLNGHTHVVALGLKATKAATSLKSKNIIFSHIFNYKEHKIVNDRVKGVSALPSPEQLFKDWKVLSPGLTSAVLMTGDNFEYYVDYAKKIAASHGIELVHHVVKNDKEFVYASKRLPLNIQGQWILPDHRILSRTALKDVMSYNSKKGKQSIVFNKSLLSFGGLFYAEISNREVVRLIIKRLNDSLGESFIPGKDVLMVGKHDMGINKKVASQLGLVIPDSYKGFLRD